MVTQAGVGNVIGIQAVAGHVMVTQAGGGNVIVYLGGCSLYYMKFVANASSRIIEGSGLVDDCSGLCSNLCGNHIVCGLSQTL